MNCCQYYAEKTGKPTVIISFRYFYHGVISKVEDDFLVLEPVRAIENIGEGTADKPLLADLIHGPIVVPFGSISMSFEPKWINDPIVSEKN